METQNLPELKKALAVKLALTSKGYKATVKGMTPDEAVMNALNAHRELLDLRNRQAAPAQNPRVTYPVLVLDEDQEYGGGYILKHGGGSATPYDPSQDLSEEYAVKIELELNSKGIGWDVTVRTASVAAGVALIEYTEKCLQSHFAPDGREGK